jgi:hypothetical protein
LLCDALRDQEKPEFRGWTEAAEMKFRYSVKGQKTGESPGRKRTPLEQRRRRRVSVVILHDRFDVIAADIVGASRIDAVELCKRYRTALAGATVLLSTHRRLEGIAVAAHVLKKRHVRVRDAYRTDPLVHLERARVHARGLQVWLERFRGVATRYLENYLSWYRHVEPWELRRANTVLLGRFCLHLTNSLREQSLTTRDPPDLSPGRSASP